MGKKKKKRVQKILIIYLFEMLTFKKKSNFSFRYHKFQFNSKLVCKSLKIDFLDPETQISIAGIFFGLLLGFGVPIFYSSRDRADEDRLEKIRALNRATKEATGQYMNEDEIYAIRPPRWTDRREFVDD